VGQPRAWRGAGQTDCWPIAALATVYAAPGAPGWSQAMERDDWIVLPVIALCGLAGLLVLWIGG